MLRNLFLAVLLLAGLSFSQKDQTSFLGMYFSNTIPYMKDSFPVKVADFTSVYYAHFIGYLKMYNEGKSYPKAYGEAVREAEKSFKALADKTCDKYPFSAVMDVKLNTVDIKDVGLLFIFNGVLVCIDFVYKR